jgi:hypothetical protein
MPKKKPKDLVMSMTWFTKILLISEKHLGFCLDALKSICGKLIGICRTLTITMLFATCIYTLLIWRHYPSAEPRSLLVGWALCLVVADLGRLALEGRNAKPIRFSVALVIALYWLPVKAISNLIASF